MTRVALFSREPARGWLPWAWLAPILLVLFNAVPVVAMDGWMQARGWSTPGGDPVGLAGLHALLWIGFAPTLLLLLAWVRGVERRSLASIGLTGAAPLKTFLRGLAIGFATIALVVGNSPLEHYWHEIFEQASARYADRVRFEWYDGLSLEQIKQRIAALPPWERGRLPYLWIDGVLAWVGGFGVDAQFACAPGDDGVLPVWQPDAPGAPSP